MAYEILTVKHGDPNRYSHNCHREFLRSLDSHSMRPIFLPGEWKGMTSKIKFLWRYLQSGKHTGSHVIFTDCFDLVFGNHALKRPNDLWPEMMDRFKSFGVPFVANAEKNCFPFPELAPHFEKFMPKGCASPFKFLNSGFMIANTEAMVEILRFMRPDEIPDDYRGTDGKMVHPGDQDFFQVAFLEQPVPMKLDYDGLLCTACHGVEPNEIRIFQTATTTGIVDLLFHQNCDRLGPMCWHFNGGKVSSLMSKVFRSLRL